MRWAGQVAQTVEMRDAYKISGGKPKRKSSHVRIDRRKILKCIESMVRGQSALIWLRISTSGRFLLTR
jgi:hypothetical protein